jgi:ABC-type phosphate/phosphonate transport system ATPase subunit
MRKGAIVFDGAPGQLTPAVARDIYGTELGDSEALEEEEPHVRHAAA